MAGRAIGSLHVLMHNGVGRSDVLKAAGVNAALGLPGVQHVQNYTLTHVLWKTTAQAANPLHTQSLAAGNGNSPPFLSFINSAAAYVGVTDLLGSDFAPQLR